MTEETPPADQTDQPGKAAKRKRPADKRAPKKQKSEQVSEHRRPSDVLNEQQSAFFPFMDLI